MILCVDTVCCSAAMDTTFVIFVEPLLQLFAQVSYIDSFSIEHYSDSTQYLFLSVCTLSKSCIDHNNSPCT